MRIVFSSDYKEIGLPKNVESVFLESSLFTEKKLEKFRRLISKKFSIKRNKSICIIAVGSYGRGEASKESDIDVYVIHEGKLSKKKNDEIKCLISDTAKLADVKLSRGFPPISINEMIKNIGGNEDTNASITNRILFLLESECLFNKLLFRKTYNKILDKYFNDIRDDCKLPRFLLNDIIRYYRTMCVDYEFKITVQGKDWAIRNVKLRFSRKALYMGGIFVLLNSLNMQDGCYEYIKLNLRSSFPNKILTVVKRQPKLKNECIRILRLYSEFLTEIGKPDVRRCLKRIRKEERDSNDVFSTLSDKAKDFDVVLWKTLNKGEWGYKQLDCLIL